MQIRSITLKNIKAHRDRELCFVNGINVLSGVNGVGKSTVFEAIGYALFGVDARDFVGNIERFISIGAKRGEIAVTFAPDDTATYRVSRGVGAGSKWLLAREINGVFEVEDHAGAAETEARLKELLGLAGNRSLAEQFKLVIGPLQHDFLGPFVLRQPTRRQEAFDEILGIDAWRKTYKGTSTLLTSVKNKIELLRVEIEARQEQIAVLPDRQRQQAGLVAAAVAEQQLLADREKALAASEQRLAELDGQEKKIQAVRADLQVLDNRLRDGRAKIVDQQQRVQEAEQALAIVNTTRPGMEAHAAAEARLKNLRQQEQQRRKIEKDLQALDQETARLLQALDHEQREVATIDTQLGDEERRLNGERSLLAVDDSVIETAARLPALKHETETLRTAMGLLEGRRAGLQEGREKLAEGVCPFFKEPCRNIAGAAPRDVFSARVEALDHDCRDLAEHLADLNQKIVAAEKARQQIDAITVRTQELDKQLLALGTRRQENDRRRQALDGTRRLQQAAAGKAAARRADLAPFTTLDAEIARIETVRASYQAARDAFFANQKDALDLHDRREALTRFSALFEALRQDLAVRQQAQALLEKEYDARRHVEVRLAKEQLVAGVATVRQSMATMGKDQQRLDDEIKKLHLIQQAIQARLVEKRNLEHQAELVAFLRNKIFNHVSAQLSERFREEISLRADRIYRTIAETDEELSWGDNYQIVLRDMADGMVRQRLDDQLSGGQIMSAVVALRLALLQTIGARVAFFDEPTSNLDAARRENLAQAFRAIDVGREEVTEHWYDQLFLISHDVAFTEVTDQIIALE